jgi:hypothetical protein
MCCPVEMPIHDHPRERIQQSWHPIVLDLILFSAGILVFQGIVWNLRIEMPKPGHAPWVEFEAKVAEIVMRRVLF